MFFPAVCVGRVPIPDFTNFGSTNQMPSKSVVHQNKEACGRNDKVVYLLLLFEYGKLVSTMSTIVATAPAYVRTCGPLSPPQPASPASPPERWP